MLKEEVARLAMVVERQKIININAEQGRSQQGAG
jgi:hypothetical protein